MGSKNYQVIVVGGGHAGAEAASAAARMGAQVLLLTHNLDALGQLSCNPAIGGIGKGHLVREISALGGLMPRAADESALHKRTLNASKGRAVQATRVQADRQVYRVALRRLLENTPNLFLFQQGVSDLILDKGMVKGVITDSGEAFRAEAVVLTTGTFLSGKIHIGRKNLPGGRAGDPSATRLSEFLRNTQGITYGRLKTGTPPRIARNSINTACMQIQPSEEGCPSFDFWNEAPYPTLSQLDCFITHTNAQTHSIIREYLHQSPMFAGDISGAGPRYCPSIEDKIHRFSSQSSHQIFIEPEGLHVNEVYPNGVSTSLPYEAQERLIQTIPGLERAHITRPGYAIEYDFFNPQGLFPWLESKHLSGLFFAGQINGTTGYEEAAAQGLLAGLNAAQKVKALPYWYPKRDEAYLGVLVDDLINQGTQEPYRMFTSRAEYRLLLREDNACWRLSQKAWELGLLSEPKYQEFLEFQRCEERTRTFLQTTQLLPKTKAHQRFEEVVEGEVLEATLLWKLVKRKGVSAGLLKALFPELASSRSLDKVLIDERYAGYIDRQKQEISRNQKDENTVIPGGFIFQGIPGLSNECVEKLAQLKPHTLGQASRISGITPAAITLLRVALKQQLNTVL